MLRQMEAVEKGDLSGKVGSRLAGGVGRGGVHNSALPPIIVEYRFMVQV